MYYEILSGEPYFKCQSPAEFQTQRKEKLNSLNIETTISPSLTPVYYNPDTGQFYYPKSATVEPKINPRPIIIGKPLLHYDYSTKLYYESSTGEPYIQTYSPAEFKQIRLEALIIQQRLEMSKVKPSCIYLDIVSNKYFYPLAALREVEEQKRDLVIQKVEWTLNEQTMTYYDPETREDYVKFDSPAEFLKAKMESDKVVVTEKIIPSKRTPIE